MKTLARLFIALVMTLSLVGSGAVLQSGTAVPVGAAPELHAGVKTCERNVQYGEILRAKGITCKRAKKVRFEAMGRWPWREGRVITVQNFRCRNHDMFAPNITCRGKKSPRQKWFTWTSE